MRGGSSELATGTQPRGVGLTAETTSIDNDAVMKVVAYGLEDRAWPTSGRRLVLGTAKFVVPGKLRKKLSGDPLPTMAALDVFLGRVEEIEPSSSERTLAADIEREALLASLPLQAGEAQLAAVTASRPIAEMQTGDKRAITALESLLPVVPDIGPIERRVACLEQLLQRILADSSDTAAVRAAVCAQRSVDTALAVAFSCSSPEVGTGSVPEALASYVNDLRSKAPTVLAP